MKNNKRKIVEYYMCYGPSPEEMTFSVESRINEGYAPFGNPFIGINSNDHSERLFYQAMIKYQTEEEKNLEETLSGTI